MSTQRAVLPKVRVSWLALLAFGYGSVLALCFVFLVYGRQSIAEVVVDLNGFGSLSRRLANGEGFSGANGPTTRRAPLYPALGAFLLRTFGSNTPGLSDAAYFRPILIFNCLVLGLTCVVVFTLARKLFDLRTAIVAAAICPLLPQAIRYVGMTEVETIMGLWIALLALTGVNLLRRPGVASAVAFGATAAAATLTKPIALLYPGVFLVIAFWRWHADGVAVRLRVLAIAVTAASFAGPLLPWMLRNRAVTDGKFAGVSSNGPGEFLRGYINAQPKYYLLRQDFGGGGSGEKWDPEANTFEEKLLKPFGVTFYRSARDASGEARSVPEPPPGVTNAMLEVQKDTVEGAEMKRRLLHEPFDFLRKFAVQLFTFWYVVETRLKSLFVGAVAAAVLTLSALGVRRARKEGTSVWPVVVLVLYFNAIYAAFLAFARYSMPLFPTLSVLAAAGLVSLWTAFRGRRTDRARA